MVIYQNEGKGTKLLRDSDTQLYHFQLKNLLSSELQSSSFGEQHVLFFRLLGPKRFKDNCSRVPEKAMAPHSTTLAWKIPWMEEPGRLQSMGSLRVGHGWEASLSFFTFMHWRRKWQPTPEFLLGESQGRQSLVGCRLWGRTESDTTEVTQQQQLQSPVNFPSLCTFVIPEALHQPDTGPLALYLIITLQVPKVCCLL